jgi:hypothetical protein
MDNGVVILDCVAIKPLEVLVYAPAVILMAKICHYDGGEQNIFPQECVTTCNKDMNGKTWFKLQNFVIPTCF